MADSRAQEPVQTSLGRMRVTFGWNRWVSVELVDRRAVAPLSRVVSSRRALAELLADAGLPRDEATTTARGLWKKPDRASTRLSPGIDAFGHSMPWYSSGWRSVAFFFIWVALIVVFAVVLIVGAR